MGNCVGRPRSVIHQGHLAEPTSGIQNCERLFADSRDAPTDSNPPCEDDVEGITDIAFAEHEVISSDLPDFRQIGQQREMGVVQSVKKGCLFQCLAGFDRHVELVASLAVAFNFAEDSCSNVSGQENCDKFILIGDEMERMEKKILLLTALVLWGCSSGNGARALLSEGKLVFEDSFERKDIGENWLDTGGGYRIQKGELRAQGALNKPLWLKKKLPNDVRVAFSAHSESPAVDIKVEIFGDGKSKATTVSYTATGYVVILGGWNNRRSIIARMNEHGDDRAVREEPKGKQGETYQFAIVRKGGTLNWFLNGEPFLAMDDTNPLVGPKHEYFAFNNWKSEVFFDDFRVFAL